MSFVAASATASGVLLAGGVAFVAIWLLLSGAVANYGRRWGYPWLPVFLCALFVGWPVVLLVVTVANGPHLRPRGSNTRWG